MFARCLLCLEAGEEPKRVAGAVGALLGRPAALHVVAVLAGPARGWVLGARPQNAEWRRHDWSLSELQGAFRAVADEVTAEVVWEFDHEGLREAVREQRCECVALAVSGERLPRRVFELVSLAELCERPVLWLGGVRSGRAGRRAVVLYEGDVRRVARALALLRDRLGPGDELLLLARGAPDPRLVAPAEVAELAGLACRLRSVGLDAELGELRARLTAFLEEEGVDLVVLVPEAIRPLTALAARWLGWDELSRGDPSLLVLAPEERPAGTPPPLDAPDVLLVRGRARVCVVSRASLGGPRPPADSVVVVARGERLAELAPRSGVAEFSWTDPEQAPAVLGFGRATASEDVLAGVELVVRVVDPGPAPLVLADADLDGEALAALARAAAAARARLLVVRTRRERSCGSVRQALRDAALEPVVFDAHLLLDTGGGDDVPPEARGVILLRLGRRLRFAGLDVRALCVLPTPLLPSCTAGLRVLSATDEVGLREALAAERAPPKGGAGRSAALRALADATALEDARVEVEFDNAAARGRLLRLVGEARRSVHLQTYIVHDDPTTRTLEAALVAAAARGVAVRVLVDSLYSLHGSFGLRNALLERLAETPGVEVRPLAPVGPLPGLVELKRRCHRKLVVVDAARALVTGRNLAESYFTSFSEVALVPDDPWERVPWLDAGALLEGPLVARVEEAFLASWREAGGEEVPPGEERPAERSLRTHARLVLHEGLLDANTLEAYACLVRSARRRITAVNTFPLIHELEHLLLAALARGVRVRLLIGNVRPKHGRERTPFASANPLRDVADELVRGHLDPLVEAGAEVVEARVFPEPGWGWRVESVWPHVHAKFLAADGECFAVGSANFDATASYWESEALLLVEDPESTRRLEAALDALFAAGARLDPGDPSWRDGAPRRARLRRFWPRVLG
ncbi:MAG: phosphatidylserine/phosphatidylglycerophosphate/cardiolipin synthase family protein [Planctomycetota bacterium]|nr:MAG: phosphatidylserine/phosphatidylglycerophosphate/cardiolipin synthase family protein [Planctomycetota bacterium]